MDFTKIYSVDEIDFYSDSSKNAKLGMGAVCGNSWMVQQWNEEFIMRNDPSIAYLELYALVAAVLKWVHRFRNKRVVIFCDNISLVHMVNNTTLRCKNCMVLIRLLVLTSMIENVRIYAKYIPSKKNLRADMLSRLKVQQLKQLFPNSDEQPTLVPTEIWPMGKIWIN